MCPVAHAPTSRAPLGLALAALLALTACGGESSSSDATSAGRGVADGTIRVLQLNRMQGHAEGVPCAPGHPSPLAGAGIVRDTFRSVGDLALLACVGETLNRSTILTPSKPVVVATQARADEVLAAMGEVGVDLWVPGHVDLGMGFDDIVERALELEIPIVLTNVDAGDRDGVYESIVFENGGPRIACLGVIPARVGGREGGMGGVVSYPGVTLLNPVESVRQTAAAIRASGEADFVAVFSNVSQVTTSRIMDLEEVDFVFASQEASARVTPVVFRGNAASFAARALGKEVGLTTIRVVDGNLQLADLSHRHTLPEDIERDEAWFEPIAQMYGTEDLDRLTTVAGGRDPQGFRERASLYLQNIEALEVMNNWADSAVDHQLARLPELPADHPTLERFARLGASIDAALEAAALGPPDPFPASENDMAGPEDCRGCHEAQYDFWRGTAHAAAYEPVRSEGRQHDPTCLRCHTTGFLFADGFNDPRIQDPLQGVSCLACHQVSAAHVHNPRLVMLANYTWPEEIGADCTICHTPRRSPGFDPMIEVPGVSCPPLDLADPVLDRVAEEALEAVARRRENQNDDLSDDYVEARALLALGRAEGLEKLLALEADNPTDVNLAIQSARLLDREGHSAEAQEVMATLLVDLIGDPAANRVYIELLLFPTDESTRDPEKALARIRMLVPEESTEEVLDLEVLKIDALFLLGRDAEARTELDRLAKVHSNDVRVLRRLHRWWPERLEDL